jgi:hypothetical protein
VGIRNRLHRLERAAAGSGYCPLCPLPPPMVIIESGDPVPPPPAPCPGCGRVPGAGLVRVIEVCRPEPRAEEEAAP